jgi:branched-chain amino acid transport system ATP-binding protein
LRIGAFAGYERERYQQDLEEMFGLFPILKERLRQPGGLLSGGEQQMLAIARALMSHPQLLMLDEPSLGLSPTMVDQIFELIATLRDRGTTILLVEQNAERALQIASRAYVLKTGAIEFSGTPEQLEREIDIAAVYFGGTSDATSEVTV